MSHPDIDQVYGCDNPRCHTCNHPVPGESCYTSYDADNKAKGDPDDTLWQMGHPYQQSSTPSTFVWPQDSERHFGGSQASTSLQQTPALHPPSSSSDTTSTSESSDHTSLCTPPEIRYEGIGFNNVACHNALAAVVQVTLPKASNTSPRLDPPVEIHKSEVKEGDGTSSETGVSTVKLATIQGQFTAKNHQPTSSDVIDDLVARLPPPKSATWMFLRQQIKQWVCPVDVSDTSEDPLSEYWNVMKILPRLIEVLNVNSWAAVIVSHCLSYMPLLTLSLTPL